MERMNQTKHTLFIMRDEIRTLREDTEAMRAHREFAQRRRGMTPINPERGEKLGMDGVTTTRREPETEVA